MMQELIAAHILPRLRVKPVPQLAFEAEENVPVPIMV